MLGTASPPEICAVRAATMKMDPKRRLWLPSHYCTRRPDEAFWPKSAFGIMSLVVSALSMLIAWQSLRLASISVRTSAEQALSVKRSILHTQISEAQRMNFDIPTGMYETLMKALPAKTTDATADDIWLLLSDSHLLKAQLYEVEKVVDRKTSVQELDALSYRVAEVIAVLRGLQPYADAVVKSHGNSGSSDYKAIVEVSTYLHHARGVLTGKQYVNPPLWPKADATEIVPGKHCAASEAGEGPLEYHKHRHPSTEPDKSAGQHCT